MHKDFLSPDIKRKDFEYVHISAKEREIAIDLKRVLEEKAM